MMSLIGWTVGWILGIIVMRYYIFPKLGLFKNEKTMLVWEDLEPIFEKHEKRLN